MPEPTLSQVHVNRTLTNFSVAFRQSIAGYVSWQAFPRVPVAKQSDLYFEFDRADFLRDIAQVRGSSQESAGSGYTLSTTAYNCLPWAFHKDVDDMVRANSDSPLAPDRNAAQFVTQVLLTRQERQWVTNFFAASIWDTDVTPSPTWDDVTSTPVVDVKTGIKTILKNTGFKPNKFVIGYEVFEKLCTHPNIVDRIKYTSSDVVTPELLARLFGVDQVLVAEAVYNTAAAGATASYDFVHGKHGLLLYAPPAPALEVPSAGYTFEWTGISKGLGASQVVGRIPAPLLGLGNVRIEGQIAFDHQVISSALGYFFSGAVS